MPLQSAGATATNSMSLSRAPAPPTDTVRGKASYIPFWPGSFPVPEQKISEKSDTDEGIQQLLST